MEKYRGDTYIFNLTLEQDGQAQKFQIGDLVRFGAKTNTAQAGYALYKEVAVEKETDTIEFVFNSEETSKLDVRMYLIEVELTRKRYGGNCV